MNKLSVQGWLLEQSLLCVGMCQHVFACRLEYQQLEWGRGLRGFCVQVPATGKAGIQGSYWAAWMLKPSFWRAPSCTCPFFTNRLSSWLARMGSRMSPSVLLMIPEHCGFCLFWSARTQGCIHVCMSWVHVYMCAYWEAGLGSTKLEYLPSVRLPD